MRAKKEVLEYLSSMEEETMAVTDRNICADGLLMLVRVMGGGLVDDYEKLLVKSRWSENVLVLELLVARSDMGKVIGKQGRTARSLRTILGGAARRWGVVCELSIGCSEAGDDASEKDGFR